MATPIIEPMHPPIFLGIPILNRVDLLAECLAAIDVPAEIVIVNNNAHDTDFAAALAGLAAKYDAQVIAQSRNLGVAASWNLIARTAFDRGHAWCFIGSNDTVLSPGSLRLACDLSKPEPEVLWLLHAFNFFLLHARTVEQVGWFDENFYPAYKEDQDYLYRSRLAGKEVVNVPGAGARHVGSATIHSNERYRQRNEETHFRWNLNHYRMKWGGDCDQERFTHPYNDPAHDHRFWPDPGGSIAARDWDRPDVS